MPIRLQLAAQPLTQASMLLRCSELLMPRSRSINACRDSTLPASLASAQSTSNSIVVRGHLPRRAASQALLAIDDQFAECQPMRRQRRPIAPTQQRAYPRQQHVATRASPT